MACDSGEAFLLGCEPERRAVVMHDQVETMTPADRIVVLRDGVVEQVGQPRELYVANSM